jgi:cyclopropane-fatty-acyl-phospholipid synthase
MKSQPDSLAQSPVQLKPCSNNGRLHSFVANKAKNVFSNVVLPSDVLINGKRPSDICIYDDRVYLRLLLQGTLGLGEAYMDGWWDCRALDQFFTKILRPKLLRKLKYSPPAILNSLKQTFFDLQKSSKAFEIAEHHYDLGNRLYESMLDQRMVYSCGYWRNSTSLDGAQEAKLDLVCRKLGFKPGMSVLDIGCGWGSFAKYAAEKYGVKVVGVTVSKEQLAKATELCRGLPVELRLQDYREVKEVFDRIVSIGMFEHVGPKNYRTYMETSHRCLKDDGLFLLHTIGLSEAFPFDPWILKYIFPSAALPVPNQIESASHGLFRSLDWHEFGADYDPTLMAWFKNFDKNWPKLQSQYDDRFYRMWKYYLLSCAGYFRSGIANVWQIVLAKEMRSYQAIR